MGSKALPRTPAEKRLALRHLRETIAFEKRKAAEHDAAPPSPYQNAHSSGHKKDVKDKEKQYKKVQKTKVKTTKKTG